MNAISKITKNHWHAGFLGAGHTAAALLEGIPYAESDPFVLFMDDRLNLPGGEPVGGPHPHAGFETLTLVVKGNGDDWQTGTFELMTAGKGIVHTEEITSAQNLHILQVWLALPPEKRWATPFFQRLKPEEVPAIQTKNYGIRVYSGSSNGLRSPISNYTPLTVVEFKLKAGQQVSQEIPAAFKGLVYVLEGDIKTDGTSLPAGTTGWLSISPGNRELSFLAEGEDAHFVFYAARPHGVPVVTYGPFVGDSMTDIARLYTEYRQGSMPHVNDLPDQQRAGYKAA